MGTDARWSRFVLGPVSQRWGPRLQLAAVVTAAATGLAFAVLSLFYEVTLSHIHRNLGGDQLIGIPIGFAMYFIALAATLAGSRLALRSGRRLRGARLGMVGLASLVPYLLISPWFWTLSENTWIAGNGWAFFATLFVSLPVALAIGVAGTIGLIATSNDAAKQGPVQPPAGARRMPGFE